MHALKPSSVIVGSTRHSSFSVCLRRRHVLADPADQRGALATPRAVPARVSIVMPAYNGGAFIGQAINSVLNQTYPNWELIVVDDGSTDNTADLVAGYKDPRVRYVYQRNAGQAAALNRGLDLAEGEFVTTLDTDDWLSSDSLSCRVDYLDSRRSGRRCVWRWCVLSGDRRGQTTVYTADALRRYGRRFRYPDCLALLWNGRSGDRSARRSSSNTRSATTRVSAGVRIGISISDWLRERHSAS